MAPAQWTPTAQCFAQHQFSQVTNFWKQGRSASFHLRSLNGQAELSLTFQLPSPSEIIPPPSPYSTTPLPTSIPKRPGAPTPLPKRPIVPLFPPGEAPQVKSPPRLSSRQQKSLKRAVSHRAAKQEAQPRKRPRSSSLPPSPDSSPVTLSQQLRKDFHIGEESPGSRSSPSQETLRGASPLNSSPSLSLDHTSLLRRDALLSPLNLNLNLTPPPLPKFLGGEEQDEQEESDIELDESKEDAPVEEPRDFGETEEEETGDVEEEEEESDTEEKDFTGESVKDLELTSEEELSKKLRVEALEDFAQGIINCFSKLPEKVCSLCEKGKEDLKYVPIRRKDRDAALEALAKKMLEWKRPDEALMQRRYAEGYDSLVKERRSAMKYHGLDVECKE